MRKITQTFEWEVFADAELPPEDLELRKAAYEAASRAFAPYSAFHVGAAVRLADGTVVTGCNQENVAYPSGLCAERVALFAAGAAHPDVPPVAIAIAAVFRGEAVNGVSPCGGCRQVMMQCEERYNRPLRTLLCNGTGTVVVPSVHDLMPLWDAPPLDSLPDGAPDTPQPQEP